jgi:transcriptional/translational regulatory protein YebC/TACO1
LLETDVEDYEITSDGVRIETVREDLSKVTKFLEENNYKIESSEIEYIPENTVALSEEDEKKLEKIIDILEDDEDVDSIYHNAE